VPPGSALAEAAGDMARTLVAVVILRRLVGARIALDRLQQVGAVLVAVVTGAAISASVALLALRAGDVITASEMSVFWRSWWLGDLSGGWSSCRSRWPGRGRWRRPCGAAAPGRARS
jgi:integral membrane sensor domain MASE1